MEENRIKSIAIQKAIRTDVKAAVWECRVRHGMSVADTAKNLQLSTATVYAYLREVLADAKNNLQTDIERWKMEQHHRYDHIYGEAINAWEHSKIEKTKTTAKAVKPRRPKADNEADGDWQETEALAASIDDPDELKVQTQLGDGDARFLQVAIAAMQAQGKLWGFNAPEVSQVDARVLTMRLEGSEGLDAIKAAEEAYRAKRFIKAEVIDGDSRDLQAESSSVVPELCQDHPSSEGSNTV